MSRADPGALGRAVLKGDRASLARAITLVESAAARDAESAEALLETLLPHAGAAMRVGISGPPGAGKSTFIEALGTRLLAGGHKIAVLAVDPSSRVSGGAILGDKTRMARLASDARAFIRPSPAGLALGGVARATREAILLVEAAGHDIVLVETVGVGQSETAVADMVDLFLVLTIAGAGDELQGLKKGLFELADLIAVNKADGDNRPRAEEAASAIRLALAIARGAGPAGEAVHLVSAATGDGLDELWARIEGRIAAERASGALAARRARQEAAWFRALIEDGVLARLKADAVLGPELAERERAVAAGATTAGAAARAILKRLRLDTPPPA
ncbi:MAG: methylmalonyl Co-A mutase-associated GTPase MeaB [Alphaproteobacteria bacterium]|nr:methylmalonyl Co-A mutase-associated GTPase MeaB [Alphaproteobacteria bacterium]